VDGTRWLLADIWPKIRRTLPDAELHIVGTVGSQIRLPSPGIVRWGEVRDLAPHYEKASIVFAPLRAGSGLKIKVLESICHGRATITTTIGAEGLRSLKPSPFLVADTAERFSSAAIHLLRDPVLRSRLEKAAVLAARRFDPRLALLPFIELLQGAQ
jgi:glycosyltransferase involved in cell wall biosynthesis